MQNNTPTIPDWIYEEKNSLFKCIFALWQLSGCIFPWLCQFLSEVHAIQAISHHHRFLGWVHYFFLSKCSNSCWKLCGMRGTVLSHPDVQGSTVVSPSVLEVMWHARHVRPPLTHCARHAGKIYKAWELLPGGANQWHGGIGKIDQDFIETDVAVISAFHVEPDIYY